MMGGWGGWLGGLDVKCLSWGLGWEEERGWGWVQGSVGGVERCLVVEGDVVVVLA